MEKKIYGVEEFLSRPQKLEEEIQGDRDHIASLRSIVERTTTHLSFTAGRNPSKNEKAFEDVMLQIAEEEKKLEEKQKKLVKVKLEVEEFIHGIPDIDQRLILRCIYLENMPMIEIQEKMNLSKSSFYRLQSAALETASEII